MLTALEPTVVNLGHTLRKQKHYDEAIQMFERALGLSPGQPGTFAALAYTYHLQVHLLGALCKLDIAGFCYSH